MARAARTDGAWGQNSSRGTFLPPTEEICPLFSFYSHETAHAALSDWSDPQKYKNMQRSPDKILFGSFLNGHAKSSGFQCEEENKLKSFCCFWRCRKGFIRGIKGGTSCSVGEVKGGVKMKMEVAAKRSCKD